MFNHGEIFIIRGRSAFRMNEIVRLITHFVFEQLQFIVAMNKSVLYQNLKSCRLFFHSERVQFVEKKTQFYSLTFRWYPRFTPHESPSMSHRSPFHRSFHYFFYFAMFCKPPWMIFHELKKMDFFRKRIHFPPHRRLLINCNSENEDFDPLANCDQSCR